MNKLPSPTRIRDSWLSPITEPFRGNQRLLRICLLFVPIVVIVVIICLRPLFLADPPSRLALLVGIAVFGFLLLRAPEIFFGLWMAGVFSVFLSFYPTVSAVHGWSLLPLAGILFYIIRRKERLFPFGSLLLSQVAFLALLCIGIAYSGDSDYGQTKAWHFLYLNLLAFVGTMFFVNDFGRVKNILLSFALGTILLAVSGLYFFYYAGMTEFSFRLTAFNYCPITFGRVSGIASLILLCSLFSSGSKRRWFLLPVLLPVSYVAVLTGTRGVLVAFMVGVVALVILRLRRSPRAAILAACIAAIALFLAFHYAPSEYTERYRATQETLLQEDRLTLWKSAYEMFLQSPLIGSGTGAFHDYVNGWAYYPHNIFLEIGAELGLMGLAVFVVFLLLTLKSAMRVILSPLYDDKVKQIMLILLVCFIFSLVEAQFSADINDNWHIWFFSGFIWSVYAAASRYQLGTRVMETQELAGKTSSTRANW